MLHQNHFLILKVCLGTNTYYAERKHKIEESCHMDGCPVSIKLGTQYTAVGIPIMGAAASGSQTLFA